MDITIEDLRAYAAMKAAVKALEEELETVYNSSPAPKDVIAGKASVRTPSDPTAMKARIAGELQDRIQQKKAEMEVKLHQIEQFSADVDDPIIGSIIRWHYIRGLSWSQTCFKVYGYPDQDTCRKAVKRYFKHKEED